MMNLIMYKCLLYFVIFDFSASEWDLNTPVWHGSIKVVTAGQSCKIQLEDRKRETVFGHGIIDKFPGPDMENVVDSKRYFVLRMTDKSGKILVI